MTDRMEYAITAQQMYDAANDSVCRQFWDSQLPSKRVCFFII